MWTFIVNWFGESRERAAIVADFNESAAQAWDDGHAKILLKSKISWGNSDNRHKFSRTWSGFRIQAATGSYMAYEQCQIIGSMIMTDQRLVRRLMRCGFDTLEIYGDSDDGFEAPLRQLLLNN
jgi:hypothetical protein